MPNLVLTAVYSRLKPKCTVFYRSRIIRGDPLTAYKHLPETKQKALFILTVRIT